MGQIYIHVMNWFLLGLTLILVCNISSIYEIENAYGIAELGVMMMTTILVTLVMLLIWQINIFVVLSFAIVFLGLELTFFSSVLWSVGDGSWIILVFTIVIFLIMYIWNYGSKLKYETEVKRKLSMDLLRELGPNLGTVRAPGIGLLYNELAKGVPAIFGHFLTTLPAVHSMIIFDDETFDEEGISIEPFNLDKEREDGYFDENGNYVEYMNLNEIKDAWFDSVDVYQKYTEKTSIPTSNDDKPRDLSTGELAEINRRIADVLEPGETVLRGLRRLKGTSTDKKQKMSAETKQLFDQLTDDAAKLMDNGDYDVYDEKQERFQREAEGYEKLVQARNHGTSVNLGMEKSDDLIDMFADDAGIAAGNLDSVGTGSVSVQPTESTDLQNDYVYDESSGYYYSSSLGYYYDPSSGFYCCAASGKWYSYNQESETYEEVPQDPEALPVS